MTAITPLEVLDHNDAYTVVLDTILTDCTLSELPVVNVSLSHYRGGFFHASVQLTEVQDVDTIATAWKLRPDTGEGTNYTRAATLDVGGRTVTIHAYTGRPSLPTYPAGYAPQAVSA